MGRLVVAGLSLRGRGKKTGKTPIKLILTRRVRIAYIIEVKNERDL